MTILIEPALELEEAITRAARRAGVTREEFILRSAAEKVRQENIMAPRFGDRVADAKERADRMAALFAEWAVNDPVTSPEDFADRKREGDEITASIIANRINLASDPRVVAIVESMNGE